MTGLRALKVAALPGPYAFPIGAGVRAGEYTGVVVAQPGPYSVTIREPSGRLLTTTTTDMALDRGAVPVRQAEPPAPADLFSFL